MSPPTDRVIPDRIGPSRVRELLGVKFPVRSIPHVVACLLIGLSASAPAQGQTVERDTLRLNSPRTDSLPPGTVHHWPMPLEAGQYLLVEVDQQGVDVVVRVLDPAGVSRREVDSPTGAAGTEVVRWVTDAPGNWTIENAGFEGSSPGEYEIEWVAGRPATEADSEGIVLADSVDALASAAMAAYQTGTREGFERTIRLFKEEAVLLRRLGDRPGEGSTLNNIGGVYRTLGRPDSALVYYRRAAPIMREVGDRGGEAATLHFMGLSYALLGRQDSALASYRRALPGRREAGDRRGEAMTLNNMGVAYRTLGQPDSALAFYRRALTIRREEGDRRGEGATLGNIGLAYDGLEQPDSAFVHYQQALSIMRELGDRRGEGTTLNALGRTFHGLGQPDSSLAHYRQAMSIMREVGDRRGEAVALNSIGVVYDRLGRPDSALYYARQALPLRRAVRDRRGEATTLNSIGVVYDGLGQPDSALVYIRQALSVYRGLGDRPGEGTALDRLGQVHSNLGQPDSALAYFRQALPISRAVADRRSEGHALNNIGYQHRVLGQPDSALAYIRQALSVYREAGDRAGEGSALTNIGYLHFRLAQPDSALAYLRRSLPIHRAVGNRAVEGTTLNNLGFSYHRATEPPDMAKAVAYYDSSAATTGLIAGATGSDPLRLSFAEQGVGLFDRWTLAWLARSGEVGKEVAELSALAASERGRAQALLDLMQGSAAQEPGADLAAEGRSLIQPLLDAGTPGLVYMVTTDTLLTWYVDPSGGVDVFRRPLSGDTLSAWVAEFRRDMGVDDARGLEAIGGRGAPTLEAATDAAPSRAAVGWPSDRATSLSRALLPAELLDRLPEGGDLAVFPHGPLNLVPFAALPAPGAQPLGARYGLRYAPSLASLLAQQGQTVAAGNTLVVGNPEMPDVGAVEGVVELVPLPGAEAEGRWVADQLGGDFLTGAAATEAEIRRRLPEASVVHLATHGYAYSTDGRARDSWVALAPDRENDGILTVAEILDDVMDLRAELVVLSACQTGLGDVKQAEGTVGLQRAFLARGARNVLVSLWNVSDEATDILMRSFYRHWRDDEGVGMAEALRRAQADVRATPAFEHPSFWAAFQLVGAL